MLSMTAFFWIMVLLFAFIGVIRGWAKELLVSFSVVLAFFIIAVLDNYTKKRTIADGCFATVDALLGAYLDHFGFGLLRISDPQHPASGFARELRP